MKEKLLIVCKDQFGYHIDTFKYCENLNKEYDITYVCLDWGKKKFSLDNVNVVYIPFKKGVLYKFAYFIKEVIRLIKQENINNIFCVYFRFSFLLSYFQKKRKVYLDIRTASVSRSKIKRVISNLELKFNALFFENITIISEGLAKKLFLKNTVVLPLGADRAVKKNNERNYLDNEEINLLYIGTLTNRNLVKTLIGYNYFLKNNTENKIKSYTIIGDGDIDEVEKLKKFVKQHHLIDKVKFLGRIPHRDLDIYFEKHNVGISYIPMTSYYNFQPPTKTFEYLMNGLVCLATNTYENKKIITSENGILCDDSPESFAQALEFLNNNMSYYKRENILNSVNNTWDYISREIFGPLYE